MTNETHQNLPELEQPTTPQQLIERLIQVRRVVEWAPEGRFHLGAWITDDADEMFNIGINEPVCGTVCCAMGWAAQDDWFNSIGLYLDGETPATYMREGWFAVRALIGDSYIATSRGSTAELSSYLFDSDFFSNGESGEGQRKKLLLRLNSVISLLQSGEEADHLRVEFVEPAK